ncbi:transcriptional regulator, LysR family [Ferrimonas balearica DSM 9799]|uniref:Transcriptional regulator, LysR family n=1 Tax=Ferrimonas balearica (strain DSM 9799 / CCM 4581 / KCTC 23876 / PAT) TaxID=550540 RepID=E1SV74_FERBD|nr:LysR family transcriptional regulator [Ferrimonas balearica]ADN77374.1 transcriptional regulator, LysR family [Ferrimonas balearica DSM 9799]
MTGFDWNLIPIFLETYKLRSYTLAADALNMTQPGVSAAIKRLQSQLGAALFVREGRGIAPTQAAVQLARSLEPAFNNARQALDNLTAFSPEQPRTFILSCDEVMTHRLHRRAEHATALGQCQLQLNLAPQDEETLVNLLMLNKVDLALDLDGLSHPTLAMAPVFEDEMLLICRKGHPRIQGPINQLQYFAEQHVALKIRRSGRYAADYFTDDTLIQRRIRCECDSLLSMMGLVATSDCLGVVTRSVADLYAAGFDLQRLPLPFSTRRVGHAMYWHHSHNNDPAHQWLREQVRQLLA